jgi:protein disulfide-isomerase-like protein
MIAYHKFNVVVIYMKFNLEKMIGNRLKQLKTMVQPKNLPRLLFLLTILVILYLIYANYLKEGMTDESEFLEGKKLVLFYADWCGHCKKVKPEWEKAASDAKGKGNMIKINCGDKDEKSSELMSKYNVEGFPTIIIFDNGTPTEYNGGRKAEDFLSVFS